MLDNEIDQQIKSISAARARRGNPLVKAAARLEIKLNAWRSILNSTVNLKKLLYLEDVMVYDGFDTVVDTWKSKLPGFSERIDDFVNRAFKEYLRRTFYFGVEINANHLYDEFMHVMSRSLRSTAKNMVAEENDTRKRYNRKSLGPLQQKAVASRMYFHVFYNTNVKASQLHKLQYLMAYADGAQTIAATWVSVIPSLYDDMHREMKKYILVHITKKGKDSEISDTVSIQNSINNNNPW